MREKQANLFTTHPSLCITCGKDIRTLGGGVWQGQGQFKCHPCLQPKLTVGSLFSGIGGFEKGFEDAGFEIKFQVEIDPWCRRVLAKHWPSVTRYEDIRNVGSHNLERVDVLIGGFPCQDISAAGKGAGIDGERSGLWREYARLIDELRPRYAVMENVGALLYRGLGRVLGDLAEIGYDAEWQILPASAFGAPHRRERIWIVAHPTHTNDPTGEDKGRRSQTQLRRSGGRVVATVAPDLAYTNSFDGTCGEVEIRQRDRVYAYPVHRTRFASWWAVEPNVGRVADGVPDRLHRLRGLGNAVVPQVAQYVAECVLAHAQASTAPQVAA